MHTKNGKSKSLIDRVFTIFKGQSAKFEKKSIPVEGREKQYRGRTMNDKYELTDIKHPEYPWLCRIRSLRAIEGIDEPVAEGVLGGFVEGEKNLDTEDKSWIYDDAICCDEGHVTGDSAVFGDSVIKDNGFVGNNSKIYRNSVVHDSANVYGAIMLGQAKVGGNAMVAQNPRTSQCPCLSDQTYVYGTVTGNVHLSGSTVITPGNMIENSTPDMLIVNNGRIKVHEAEERSIIKGPVKRDKFDTKQKTR